MITLITIVHIIVCFFLVIVVLLQSGKSGDNKIVTSGASRPGAPSAMSIARVPRAASRISGACCASSAR